MEETGKTRALSLVRGECPACLLSTLFVAEGGHLTCSNAECPCPDTMIAFKVRESGMPFHRKGDRLPTGEEFIGYTDDGTPLWNEPVSRPPFQLELDDYEIVNLREGLVALMSLGCDTGDWLGQILNRLPSTKGVIPNATASVQVRRVRETLARKPSSGG